MGRLAEHWRTVELLEWSIPGGAPGESADCPPPERARVPFVGWWPRDARWAACFPHDVELAEGRAAMDRFAGIEEASGIRSTWFIVPERRRRSRVVGDGSGARIEGPAAKDGNVWWASREGEGVRVGVQDASA